MVTGVGLASPIGSSPDELARSLRSDTSGVRFMHEWSHVRDLQGRLGANVDGLSLDPGPRLGALAVYATERALESARLPRELLCSGRCGVAYGSTSGSSGALERLARPLIQEHTLRGIDPSLVLAQISHAAALEVASRLDVRGRVIPTNGACASGSMAIGWGLESIRSGACDVMICGGAEEQHYMTAVTFDLLMAMSVRWNDRPELSPRPFDARRDGLVIGEGAGTLVLESEAHARARGATIVAELIGFGTSCDGGHLTAPARDGMRSAMELALHDSGVDRDAIDYVNAHATGTDVGDVEESHATWEIFERAVPISSIKGYMGHTLGACGAIEAIASIGMLREGYVAANKNLDELDPRCASLDYVRETRQASLRTVMSNNFAFGGVNTSLVFRRADAAAGEAVR